MTRESSPVNFPNQMETLPDPALWTLLDYLPDSVLRTCLQLSQAWEERLRDPEYYRHRLKTFFNISSVNHYPRRWYWRLVRISKGPNFRFNLLRLSLEVTELGIASYLLEITPQVELLEKSIMKLLAREGHVELLDQCFKRITNLSFEFDRRSQLTQVLIGALKGSQPRVLRHFLTQLVPKYGDFIYDLGTNSKLRSILGRIIKKGDWQEPAEIEALQLFFETRFREIDRGIRYPFDDTGYYLFLAIRHKHPTLIEILTPYWKRIPTTLRPPDLIYPTPEPFAGVPPRSRDWHPILSGLAASGQLIPFRNLLENEEFELFALESAAEEAAANAQKEILREISTRAFLSRRGKWTQLRRLPWLLAVGSVLCQDPGLLGNLYRELEENSLRSFPASEGNLSDENSLRSFPASDENPPRGFPVSDENSLRSFPYPLKLAIDRRDLPMIGFLIQQVQPGRNLVPSFDEIVQEELPVLIGRGQINILRLLLPHLEVWPDTETIRKALNVLLRGYLHRDVFLPGKVNTDRILKLLLKVNPNLNDMLLRETVRSESLTSIQLVIGEGTHNLYPGLEAWSRPEDGDLPSTSTLRIILDG